VRWWPFNPTASVYREIVNHFFLMNTNSRLNSNDAMMLVTAAN